MHIVIYCPGMPFNGASIGEGQSLGGSESAAHDLARELARRDCQVTLFTTIPESMEGAWEGVRYLSRGAATPEHPLGIRFEGYATAIPHDVLIMQRIPGAFSRQRAGKLNLWWTHDLALKRHLPHVAGQLWNVDQVLAVSEFHKAQVAQVYGIAEEQITVVPNGVELSRFRHVADPDSAEGAAESVRKREGGLLTYTSRPERGLEALVRPDGIMERLARKAPELRLHVAGYDNTTPAMQGYYADLWERCRILPNVELLGALSKKELADLHRAAWLHVYPTSFEETSCITAMEAQAAGTPILTSPVGALPETLAGGGVAFLDADAADPTAAAVEAILGLRREPRRWEELRRRAFAKRDSYGWAAGVDVLLGCIERLFTERCANPRRLARHLLRRSDIQACRALIEREPALSAEADPALHGRLAAYAFAATGRFAEHYEAFAKWQQEQAIDQGHADPARLLAIPRMAPLSGLIASLPAGARVLDFGCGEGQFTLAFARQFPDRQFVGMDLSPAGIAAGERAAEEAGVKNLALLAGDETRVKGQFDLILACEVLEHVPDPGAVADRLRQHLRPGGTMAITVPFGPWEAESETDVPFRQHLHQLERQDLLDLWGAQPGYRATALPVRHTREGEALGSYLVTFGAGGPATGRIDMARKLRRQAPRETLSVCMVVRDKGATLARTLESVAGVADQIVIGIDGRPEAGGPAWEIGARFGAECFPVGSPLQAGFDAARNATLTHAWGDWVLWIDDDEVLEWPHRLHKYLRPNGYAAYAVKQHHYAVEPEGLIKTDLPCRLFRRRPGVRFFGVVHEHPERALNAGLGPTFLLPDVALCHNGYETEEVRRERFRRNLPLMHRDRQVYPERALGKFLWIRDLAHLNRYAAEQGRHDDPAVRLRAEEAVGLWRELLHQGPLRMAVDALPYYSEAVATLCGEGIRYEVALAASRAGLGELNGHRPSAVGGQFMDTGDIRRLTEQLLREKTAIYEEKYF